MKLSGWFALLLTFSTLTAIASDDPTPKQDTIHLPPGIDWFNGDVKQAFDAAKASNRPVLLFFTATWCPPCNGMKATVLNQQSVLDRLKRFVPVYLDDSDLHTSEVLEQYKLHGYPSTLLLRPDGKEISHLSGAPDLALLIDMLDGALANTRPNKELLDIALNGGTLTPTEWRLLANSDDWAADNALVPRADYAKTMLKLAKNTPATLKDIAQRFEFNGLSSATNKKPIDINRAQSVETLVGMLNDPTFVRKNYDCVYGVGTEVLDYLAPAGTTDRSRLLSS